MKSTCWDTRATDSMIRSGQKDTEASILYSMDFDKDFVSLGRHLWRCRERNHHDNGSNDARSSHQRSIVSVKQTYLQSSQIKYNVLVVKR